MCLKTCSKVLTQEQMWKRRITVACAPSHAWLREKGIFSMIPYSLAGGELTSLERENILGFPYTVCSAMPFREVRRKLCYGHRRWKQRSPAGLLPSPAALQLSGSNGKSLIAFCPEKLPNKQPLYFIINNCQGCCIRKVEVVALGWSQV